MAARLKDALGLWLIAAARKDAGGTLWDAHAPIHSSPNADSLAQLLAINPAIPMLLDVPYLDPDEEYLDVTALQRWSGAAAR
jgi:hypothetical protein